MTDKPDVWMPLVIGDYRKDTGRLTRDLHGGYLLLIMEYWVNGPIPDDDEDLAAIVLATPREWAAIRPKLVRFFHVENGVWRHKRIDQELERWSAKKRVYANRAAAAAEKRWAAEGREAGVPRSKRLSDARARGTHTPEEWGRMKAFFGRCVRCGHEGELVKDHIVPLYMQGADDIENIQPLCRSCNAGKGRETVDYRGSGWREHVLSPASMPPKRLLDACLTPAPQPAPRRLEDPHRSSNPSRTAPGAEPVDNSAPGAVWPGPAGLWDAVAEKMGEPWARSWLAACEWDEDAAALIAPRDITVTQLERNCRKQLVAARVETVRVRGKS
jgi:uncharacterized protein YdaU (DUF1376 family)